MSAGEGLTVAVEDPDSADGRALRQALDADLRARYPAASIHGFDPREIADSRGAFVVARVAGRPAGCGAVRPLGPGAGEVKRIFVEPAFRGRGIARAVLRALEAAAGDLGFGTLRLETGSRQPEAIALFESAGYVRIPPWGEYLGDPFSVCYEKRLSDGDPKQHPSA
jgi:GNAT superfamily N-acetyltransferase